MLLHDYGSFLPQKGDYKKLRCFQLSEHLYDITFVFCDRFLNPADRTRDQMIQAARSAKQNIAEGSCASTMSKKSELFLTNVAKSSLQELLLDYEDFQVVRKIKRWGLDDLKTLNVREALTRKMTRDFMLDKAQHWDAETLVNVAITLIHQIDKMLLGLLNAQKRRFLCEGGVSEEMSKARRDFRNRNNSGC